MSPDFIRETCFTCSNNPLNFHKISDGDSKLNIFHIICHHFWFKEGDLQNAIICETCWEKVDQFHQFYLDVKKIHENREVAPLSMFIKQEEITIEETQLQENCTSYHISAENQKLLDIADCKHEFTDECNELSKKERLVEVPNLRKKSKYTRRQPLKRVVKRKNLHLRKPTLEERQAEDDFIKKHTSYICGECNIEFESFLAIKNHRITTHSMGTVVCCGRQYRNRSNLYQHVQSLLNPEAFKCEICDKSFKFKKSYIRHREMAHAAEEKLVFKCNRCPSSFITERLLKSHMAGHETLENETAKCEFCGKCFRHKYNLSAHIKAVHKKPMDFICEVCSKGFYHRTKFVEHYKTHKLTAEQLKEQCPVCNKWLKNHHSWQRHISRHNARECKCEVCGHISSNMHSLQMHMYTHAPDRKRHVCEQCGRDYSRATDLKKHVSIAHTREHLIQCKHCEKKFISRPNMYSHWKQDHPQEWQKLKNAPNRRRHVCEQCGKEYSRAISLKEHVAIAHTREYLYQCEHCEKKFFSNANMYSHRKMNHPQEWLMSQKARREEISVGGETDS